MSDFNMDIKNPIQLAEEFHYKRINEEEYIRRIGGLYKRNEAELLASDPKIFERLLKQLPRVYRVNLMSKLSVSI